MPFYLNDWLTKSLMADGVPAKCSFVIRMASLLGASCR
jgi:hypothetical protein